MYNTIGDVALANTSRETKYFHDVVQYPNKSSSPFISLEGPRVCSQHVLKF